MMRYYLDMEHEHLWIIPPRAGSHSVRHVMRGQHRIEGIHVTKLDRRSALRFTDLTTFCFVRHPYERVVSVAYHSRFMDSRPFSARIQEWVLEPAREEMDPHFRPQSDFVDGFAPTHFGRLEDLHIHVPRLQELYPHLNDAPPPQNVGRGRPARWTDVDYDWSLIEPLYSGDMNLWEAACLD